MSTAADSVLSPPETGPDRADSAGSDRKGDSRLGRRLLVALIAVGLVIGLAGWMITARSQAMDELYATQVAQFEDATGIRVVRVVLTAAGGIVDFQYRVLDPDKAVGVHDDEAPPGLVDEKTGAIIGVPFHDHEFRELHTGVTYREMFMNGGGLLERGSKVTLTVGGNIIEHIEVG